ncbi:hypothetical protein TNCV_3851501 [Trichonephila clavipes]|nr:hypothetical protein TNCV_3851501 [Trichonephila clavipes]
MYELQCSKLSSKLRRSSTSKCALRLVQSPVRLGQYLDPDRQQELHPIFEELTKDYGHYWDIVFLPPILILLDGLHNIEDHEQVSGDSNPEARGHHTQGSKFKEQKKHFTSLDILVQIMIQEELERIGKKPAASLK